MHPSDDIRGSRSGRLSGRKIVMGITGSIAAVECVKLARELIRHGAEVHAVMTEKACEIIGPYSMEFATGNPVVTHLTGKVEHVSMCGDVEGKADLILIAPCTANTLGKMVHGIDDTPVLTFLTTGIGTGIPVMLVPAMHSTMYDHPKVMENLGAALKMGILVIDPRIEEKKAKMASTEIIVEHVLRLLSGGSMRNERVLIVTGATREPVDDMRILTNRASGASGIALGVEAFRNGAEVLLMAGENVVKISEALKVDRFSTTGDLLERIKALPGKWKAPTMAFFAAGISDYSPKRKEGKIPSGKEELIIELGPTPKVIEVFRGLFPEAFLVGYKAESIRDPEKLLERAYERLTAVRMQAIVANDLSDVTPETNTVYLVTPQKEVFKVSGKRSDIASFLLERTMELRGTR
ncbi:MAG: bifunctional phosphopantothenoylcysteine decarboxylase/phosphopantothenate--cysteine ligase CoaBC [Candidatus Thermoplasmatota archaeon]|nr:bifunctional phosphopantothenoylcysteine decarboxylase/phosphopantothenate--cysteine ligase CoaBC [Candidatus Thermoplasmatota archaeon]